MLQSPAPLTSLSADAHGLTPDAFQRKYGDAFFVHAGVLEETARPILRTMSDRDNVGMGSAADALQVVSVRAKEGNVFPDFISIGRAPNNDVVLVHSSVSKFQAFIRPHSGGMLMQDGGSSNGTFVENTPVPAKGKGDPIALTAGMNIRFGSLEVTFLDADALKQMVQLLTPAPSPPNGVTFAGVPAA